mgnify:CR=1 FL=1
MLKKIASNTFAQILSKVGTAIISIFLISILTNYLTVDLYGLYLKIYNYISIFVFLADLWLYTIAIREISANKNDTQKIVWNVLTIRVILAFIIFAIAIWLAFFLPGYDTSLALWWITIICFFTLFQLINSSIMTLMQANMKIEFSMFSAIFAKLVNLWAIAFIVFVVFVKQGTDFDYFAPFLWIIWTSVLASFVNTVLNYFYARRIQKFWFAFDWDYIKHIFKISLPYWIALFLSVVYFKVDIILLSLLDENWDTSIALYSVPMRIVEVIMVLGGFYLNSVLPSLSQSFKNKSLDTFQKLIQMSFKFLFAGWLLIFVLWVLFRENMIEIVANREYLDTGTLFNSADAFLVVFAVVLFHFISLVFIYTLIATNYQSRLLKINIAVTLFNIIWNIILIPIYSFIWAGIITLFSQILLMSLWYFYCRHIVHFEFPWKDMIKNIIFGIFIFIIWTLLIHNCSLGIIWDMLIYGWILFWFYCGFFYLNYKNILQKNSES